MPSKHEVGGSSPSWGTYFFAGVAQRLVHLPSKQDFVGSNPIARSPGKVVMVTDHEPVRANLLEVADILGNVRKSVD